MLRLIGFSALSAVLTVFTLLPAYQTGQLSPAAALFLALTVSLMLGVILTNLTGGMEKCGKQTEEGKTLSRRLIWSFAEGFCLALSLLMVLAVINLAHWGGVTTLLDSQNQAPGCVFLTRLLAFGPWNFSIASAMVVFFPLRVLGRALLTRWICAQAV